MVSFFVLTAMCTLQQSLAKTWMHWTAVVYKNPLSHDQCIAKFYRYLLLAAYTSPLYIRPRGMVIEIFTLKGTCVFMNSFNTFALKIISHRFTNNPHILDHITEFQNCSNHSTIKLHYQLHWVGTSVGERWRWERQHTNFHDLFVLAIAGLLFNIRTFQCQNLNQTIMLQHKFLWAICNINLHLVLYGMHCCRVGIVTSKK